MVDAGKVKKEEREGNMEADTAATKGLQEDLDITAMAKYYETRLKGYSGFMKRIRKFIVEVKQADKEKRQSVRKQKDPFQDGKDKKVQVP